MNDLYRNAGDNPESSFVFDDEALKRALKRIYEKDFNPMTMIEENLFNATWETMNRAVDKGFGVRQNNDPDFDFYNELKYNNAVFSAFKVHRMQNDMAAQLLDADGKLKPFNQWVKDTEAIQQHHVYRWLKTEYDTAVIRAHQAADWQQFEREADILPNLKWLPSTSIVPGLDHKIFWNRIWSINDPHWTKHRPGDRWNCKCGLTATDEPVTDNSGIASSEIDNPSSGLDNNPGITGEIFSKDHPYFTEAYEGAEKAVEKYISEKVKNDDFVLKFDGETGKEIDRSGKYLIDDKYGKRLLTHTKADKTEVEDNIETAKTILAEFPKAKIKILEHSTEKGIKNPEFSINGRVADAKRIHSEKGITAGFKKAIDQGCEAVVIDFDKFMSDKHLHFNQVARYIDWRKSDFESGTIKDCYVVHRGKVVRITKKHSSRELILKELEKLKP